MTDRPLFWAGWYVIALSFCLYVGTSKWFDSKMKWIFENTTGRELFVVGIAIGISLMVVAAIQSRTKR